MAYTLSTFRIVDALEDLLDAVGRGHMPPATEDAIDRAYDVLNEAHEETDQIRAIATSLRASDGTFSRHNVPIHHHYGFQVGGVVETLVDPTDAQLFDFIETFRSMAVEFYIGSWTDEDGHLHIDVSTWEMRAEAAMVLADVRGETAIWDWQYETALMTGVRSS